MDELTKILFTFSLTVLGGIFVYVEGQAILYSMIKPLQGQREIIGRIAHALILYGNVYTNPGTPPKAKLDEVSLVFRELSASLMEKTAVIWGYWWIALCGDARKKRDVFKAHEQLIFLSNSVHKGDGVKNQDAREKIEKLLGIKK